MSRIPTPRRRILNPGFTEWAPRRWKPMMSVLAEATMPALPSSIRVMITRRRKGWSTTFSDSEVVKPEPVKADRAWKRAAWEESPVATRMTVATLVIRRESATTTSSEPMAYTRPTLPQPGGSPRRWGPARPWGGGGHVKRHPDTSARPRPGPPERVLGPAPPFRPGHHRHGAHVSRRPPRRGRVSLLQALCLLALAGLIGLGAFLASIKLGGAPRKVSASPSRTTRSQGHRPRRGGSHGAGSASPGTTATTAARPTTTAAPRTTASPPTTAHTTSTTTGPSAAPGGGPQLTGLTPGQGAPGSTVVLVGTGLYSSTGTITVTFGGRAAPVRCSSRTRCTATVPQLGVASGQSVPVILSTPAGSSNPLTFTYRS